MSGDRFICYECRANNCAHCIGIPCMCPCPIPKRGTITEGTTMKHQITFTSGDECTMVFDFSKPDSVDINVTPFPQTVENWQEFQAWTGGVVAQAIEAATPQQLLALVDQAAALLRRLSGNDPAA